MSHMTLDDRVSIQEGLDNNLSPSVISRKIGKTRSTVLREIIKHRVFKGKRYPGAKPPCIHKKDCIVYGLCKDRRCSSPCKNCHACKDVCPDYFPSECDRLSKSPHVCNGCPKVSSCCYEAYYYYASYAHKQEHIDMYFAAVDEVFALMAEAIKKGNAKELLLGPVCMTGFQRLA